MPKALVLVDLQNDFLPGGALAVPHGDEVIPVANRLACGGGFDLVVATKDWHPADHGSFASRHAGKAVGDHVELGGLDQVLWPDHCVQWTGGAEFAPLLRSDRIARVVRKGVDPEIDSYSTFFDNAHRRDTGLGELLRRHDADEVYLMGLATDYCVKFSVLDALKLGFRAHVVIDGCRGIELSDGDVERAVQEMLAAGAEIVCSERLVAADEEQVVWRGEWIAAVTRGKWEYVRRRNVTGIVGMVAVTDEGKLLLVEQHRAAVGGPVVELPAGLVGDEPGRQGEPLEAAARRELIEETGYEAARMERLVEAAPSAGLSGESITLFRAAELRKVGPGGGDDSEDITVHEVPLGEVEAFCDARRRAGAVIDAKIYAGLYFLR